MMQPKPLAIGDTFTQSAWRSSSAAKRLEDATASQRRSITPYIRSDSGGCAGLGDETRIIQASGGRYLAQTGVVPSSRRMCEWGDSRIRAHLHYVSVYPVIDHSLPLVVASSRRRHCPMRPLPAHTYWSFASTKQEVLQYSAASTPVLCGKYSSTQQVVLQYSAGSTPVPSSKYWPRTCSLLQCVMLPAVIGTC